MSKFRRLIVSLLLFPVFGLMSVSEGEGAAPERPADITEEEWDEATPEEREAMVMDGEGEVGGYIDGTEDEPEEEDDLTEEELAAVAGEEEAGGEVVAAEAAAAEAKADLPTDEDLLGFQPIVTAAEVRAKLPKFEVPQEIQAKIDELDDRFENGWEENGEQKTMTLKEYNQQSRTLNQQAQEAIADARLTAEDNARAEISWVKAQQAFTTAHPEYLAADIKGKALWGALNETVQTLNADPKNAVKSDMQILIMAHKAVAEAFGLGKAVAPTEKGKEKEKAPAASKKGVTTLAHVPAAAGNDTSDPFSALDRLSGEALERAIERLTPAQRERYEARY